MRPRDGGQDRDRVWNRELLLAGDRRQHPHGLRGLASCFQVQGGPLLGEERVSESE